MKRILNILTLILSLGTAQLLAQTPGTLDISYGTNGKMSGYFPAKNGSSLYIYDLHKLAEGKMIGIMNKYYYDAQKDEYIDTTVVAQVLANGNADPSFGVYGELKTEMTPLFILPQQDGKLLIGFNDQEELILRRYSKAGSIDGSYGIDGTSYTGIFANMYNCTQENNGDLSLLGSVKNNNEMALARLKYNGERKFNFGKDGIHLFDFDAANYYESPSQILVQNDGKIVIAGNEYSGGNYAFVCRLNVDGSYDSTFSGDGKLRISSNMGTNALKLLDNGKIVIGGTYYYSNYSKSGFTLAKINANGTMDASFGTTGYKNFNFGGQDDFLYGLLVQEDGKILVAGSTAGRFALARINTNATYDLSFNTTGKSITDFEAGSTGSAHYMSFEADQKLWVTGLIRRADLSIGFCSARFYLGNTVGLIEEQSALQTNVYPNPFFDQINLDLNLANKESLSVNLYSLEGAFITNLYLPKELTKGTHTLELNTSEVLAKGIYLMQIKIGEQDKWLKMVKD